MIVLGGLVLLFWLAVLPVFVGSLLAGKECVNNNSIVYRFMAGNMLLWAVFQLVSVPFIVAEKSFSLVVTVYVAAAVLLCVAGALCFRKNPLRCEDKQRTEVVERVIKAVFFALFLLQLVCAVVMTYGDGDDAYYVAVSTIANQSDTMYRMNPYSYGYTGLDIRHGLAPFPLWIAFLARISGMHTTFITHVVAAVYLIGMSYGAFYLVGKQLFGEKKQRYLFMVFMALLVIFGDCSFRTPENFMIARSRQGKAAMGSIIIPMIVFLMLLILVHLKEGKKVGIRNWFLLAATVTAACLCTTLGTSLVCMIIGLIGVCALVVYKRLWPVCQMAACCVPAVCYALLYFILG